MNKIIRTEYNSPQTTVYTLSVLSVMCASQSAASIQSFIEDAELVW